MPRRRLKPTDEQRRLVKSMAAMGIRQDEIARKLDIRSPKRSAFTSARNSTGGATDANYNVANALYKQVMKGNATAAIFWLKTRAGWRERSAPEHATVEPPPFVVALESGVKS
jgi:hypothetical protein